MDLHTVTQLEVGNDPTGDGLEAHRSRPLRLAFIRVVNLGESPVYLNLYDRRLASITPGVGRAIDPLVVPSGDCETIKMGAYFGTAISILASANPDGTGEPDPKPSIHIGLASVCL